MGRCTNQLLPAKATAGLSFAVSAEFDAYPVTDWSAQLLFRGPAVIDIDGVASGSAWTFTADSATTLQWQPGVYWYSLRVQSATETREVANGQIEFLPDFAGLPVGYDGRTKNKIALDSITAVLAKRATLDQQRYTIGDRELWRTPASELLKLKSAYTAAVRRERAAAKGCNRFGRAIPVRFHN